MGEKVAVELSEDELAVTVVSLSLRLAGYAPESARDRRVLKDLYERLRKLYYETYTGRKP